MTRFYFGINSYMTFGNRTVPNVMVTFSAPFEGTVVLRKDITYFLFIFSHYKTILSRRSDKNAKVTGETLGLFNARSSGTAKRTRSSNASYDPDSNTRPGMSSLVAIQTSAVLSQVNLCWWCITIRSLYHKTQTFYELQIFCLYCRYI